MKPKEILVFLLTTAAVLSSLMLCADAPKIQEEKISSLHYDLVLERDLGSENTRLEIRDRLTGEVLISENRSSVLPSPVEWTLDEVHASLHEIACNDSVSLLFVMPAEQSYSEGLYIATISKARLNSGKKGTRTATLHEYGLLYDVAVTERGDMAFCSGWQRDGQCLLDAMVVRLETGAVEKEIPFFMLCPKEDVAFRDSEGEGQKDYVSFQTRLKGKLKALLTQKGP